MTSGDNYLDTHRYGGEIPIFRKNDRIIPKTSKPLDDPRKYLRWEAKEVVKNKPLMFQPGSHFPRVQTHKDKVMFMANGNVSSQWLFGRNTPFPDVDPKELGRGRVEPRYKFVFGNTPYQVNPWFRKWEEYIKWLTTAPPVGISPLITVTHPVSSLLTLGETFGGYGLRQEWAIHRLQDLFERSAKHKIPLALGIREQDLKGLISDEIDMVAYYLQRKGWFREAKRYFATVYVPGRKKPRHGFPQGADLVNLMEEFHRWAVFPRIGKDDGITAIKWLIFYYHLKQDIKNDEMRNISIHSGLYNRPYHFYWPPPFNPYPPPWLAKGVTTRMWEAYNQVFTSMRGNIRVNMVQDAIEYAAENTWWNSRAFARGVTVKDYLRFRVTFRYDGKGEQIHYGGIGGNILKATTLEGKWDSGPPSPKGPTRWATTGSKLPVLVRFSPKGKDSLSIKAWIKNAGIVSDLVNILPEFDPKRHPVYLQRYDNSIRFSAEGRLYELPLKEEQLLAEQPGEPKFFRFEVNSS